MYKQNTIQYKTLAKRINCNSICNGR